MNNEKISKLGLLYHGSGFNNSLLKPGFNHTGILVKWDQTENNKFLYATTDRDTAIELGFASSIEKTFEIDRFHVENKSIIIESQKLLSLANLKKVPVFLYTIVVKEKDDWIKNINPNNNINTEYKTSKTINSISSIEKIDISSWLNVYNVKIIKSVKNKMPGYFNL